MREVFECMLQGLVPDPDREGLQDTPDRMVKAWEFWTSGYSQDPEAIATSFIDGREGYDEIILVKDIPVYSHCEHHLAPFFGVAHVGYIPNEYILGLSKIPRIVNIFARRLQVQERLTREIADTIEHVTDARGVGVVIECRHLCMESRGVERPGTQTVTSAMRGALMNNAPARAEFFSLVRK